MAEEREGDEVTAPYRGGDLPLLTNSRLRAFRDCNRLHDLQYVQGFRPVRESEALRFGTLIHTALEAWWRAELDPLIEALVAIRGKAFDAFEQERANAMIDAYDRRWRDERDLYEVLAVEQEFRAPLVNPATMMPSRTWQIAGKVDVIVRRKSDGRVLVVDHKTTSDDVQSDDAIMWTKLQMDSQASMYVLGAESLGYEVDELLWDVLKKPGQRPKLATPVADRKYTKDGALYKAQREFDETPAEYGARIREVLSEAPDRFFQRRSFPRLASQIADFMADAWTQAATMRESAALGRSARNVDACHRYGTCPYWVVCSAGGHPSDYPADFVKVENVHPELTKENA